MSQKGQDSREPFDYDSQISRRTALRTVSSAAAAGVAGTGALANGTGKVQALHCGTGKDDDKYQYEEERSEVTEEKIRCGYYRFASSTDLAYIGSIQWEDVDYKDGDGATHVFYVQTTAAAEESGNNEDWRRNRSISTHEFEVDSGNSNTSVDFCENNTGVYPYDTDDEVEINWDKVAELAVDVLASAVEQPVDVLITAMAIIDAPDYSGRNSANAKFTHNRRSSDNSRMEPKTKVQGTFEVNVPGGEECTIDIEARTEAWGPCESWGEAHNRPNEYNHTQEFWVEADDDSVKEFFW